MLRSVPKYRLIKARGALLGLLVVVLYSRIETRQIHPVSAIRKRRRSSFWLRLKSWLKHIALGRLRSASKFTKRTRRKGRIINVASNAGVQAISTLFAYVVSKTALVRFNEALALETLEDGIQVLAIHPGTVRTPMNAYVHDSQEVTKSAPAIQQWFQALYAGGLDTPIDRSVQLLRRLAAGNGDRLSGRYISVENDLDALV